MIRYFISYKTLINDEKLEMDLDLFSPELVVIRKNKDGNYRVEPILYFNGYRKDLVTYADKITQNKKDVSLMVELSEEMAKKISSLYLHTFETLDSRENKNILKEKEDKVIKLINYNCYKNMSLKDSEKGYLVLLENSYRNNLCVRKFSRFNLERKNIIISGIGNDVYFYTEDEDLIEKFEEDVTELKEKELDSYEIIKNRIIIIDSISQDRINDLNDSSLRALFELCNSSIPVYSTLLEDDSYNLSLKGIDKSSKKGYMIVDFNIQTLMLDSLLVPLLRYINVYELENDSYKKTNIEDYMKERDILKYIKRPN